MKFSDILLLKMTIILRPYKSLLWPLGSRYLTMNFEYSKTQMLKEKHTEMLIIYFEIVLNSKSSHKKQFFV